MTAASAGESTTTLIWSATTNWIVAEGSLSDSISFDTSDNVENNQESKPLLLLRPDGGDPPPCEIRIYFRERHEIKMVYVRSTARVYEIYYSSDHQDSNGEYLTTVRCGAAVEEVAPESLDGCRGNNNGNSAITGQVVRSGSNTSDEDGWVQVKPPDSILQDDKEYYVVKKYDSGRDSPKMQIHYEATAEISDCSPCFSITLRLLSIQTKNCVHVEEIYVCADPVESCDLDPPLTIAQNSGASSMFAMLMPSLMQLSKSVTSHERSSSDETRVPKYPCSTAKSEHTVSFENSMAEEVSSEKPPDKRRSPTQEQTEAKAAKFEVTAPPQMPDSLGDQNNNEAYTRIEKVLDDLVLKVGRVEAFCSKFEENMLKPLACMEKRLQQLEQKLDVLAAKSQSSVQCLCSNVASSESNEYNSNSEDGNVKRVDQRDIESIEHSAQIEGSSIKFPERREDTTFIGMTSPADDKAPAILEPQTHPGLMIKAPEFLNEDDIYSNTDVDPLREDIPKNKKSSSIDGALASSLAAFLTSTIVKSPDPNPSVTAISQESVNSVNGALDSLSPFYSDGAGNLSDKSATEDNGCGFVDADGEGSIIAEISSKMDNSSSGKPEAGTECTAFDDSLSVTDADELSPAFAFQSDSGFIGVPLELPSDNTLESHELDCLEDAEVLALENQEEYEIRDEAYLDPALISMPLEASCEQEDCTIFKLYGECTAFDDSLLVANADELSPASAFQSDSGFIGMPVELPSDNILDTPELDCLEGPTSIARFRETIPPLAEFQSSATVDSTKSTQFNAPSMSPSIDNNELSLSIFEVPSGGAEVSALENLEEYEIQDEPYLDPAPGMPLEASCERDDCTLFNLYGEVSHNCRGKICVDDDDAGKAVLQCFDTEDGNSFSSSLQGSLIKQMLDTELSLGGSSGSSAEVSAVADHTKLRAATNNSERDLASEGHSKEVEDVMHNVKFNSDGNWVRGLSLELLLGEILDTKPLDASTGSGDGGSIDIELKLSGNSSSTLGLNSVDDEDGSFLL